MSKEKVDIFKIMAMCQFHDVSESRISDLNYVHQKYTDRKEEQAANDLANSLPFGNNILNLLDEYHKRETYEAKLAKDSDNLELLLSLKEQTDVGNKRAKTWVPPLLGRLITNEAKKLSEEILKTDSDAWWYGNKKDKWWINRKHAGKRK